MSFCSPSPKCVDQQIENQIVAMTQAEKLSLVSGTLGVTLLVTDPGERRIGAGHVPGIDRLGIPALFEADASLGVANAGGKREGDVATALPSGLAIAASFDRDLAFAGGRMIGSEARAKGFNVLLAGGANLIRDAWGGRAFEYLSEDTLLTGVLAGESIRGIQSNHIISTIKHFALNPQETGRYVVDSRIDEAALRESDLLAFEIAIEIGSPWAVMTAYNKVNGQFASENAFLLSTVLKAEWGYRGWVMSDWGGVHSTEDAAKAGLDQQSGRERDRAHYFGTPLLDAVAEGRVDRIVLDDKVRRIVGAMHRSGLMDQPCPAEPQAIDYDANADVAQAIAEAGIVLLRNEEGILPLDPGTRRILVIGGHANIGVLSGGGSSQVRSVGGNALEMTRPGFGPFAGLMTRSYHSGAPLDAIRKRIKEGDVTFCEGEDLAEAVKLARKAEIVIVFAEEWRTEVLDNGTLRLDGAQDELLAAVAAANECTIVVLETGGPVLMPWLDRVKGVLAAWYPGQRGGEAIARVLFGEVDASGRLPVTFPRSVESIPRPAIPGSAEAAEAFGRVSRFSFADLGSIGLGGGQASFAVEYAEGADVGYRWYVREGIKPAFPFGFGLSYTDFAFQDFDVANDYSFVTLVVANVGAREGVCVPQVYAIREDEVPILVGFARLSLAASETMTIRISLDLRPAQRFCISSRSRRPVPDDLRLALGTNAGDLLEICVARSSTMSRPVASR